MIDALERPVEWLARATAMIGGVALLALILITVLSVSGRALIAFGLGPVPGDFELVESGTAFAIFAFLPWCQFTRGHARVDILASRFGDFINNIIDVVTDLALLCVWAFLIYRLVHGAIDKSSYGETTFILQFPIWWSYAACLLACIPIAIIAVFCLARSVRNLAQSRAAITEGSAH